jgi:spore germination protein KB
MTMIKVSRTQYFFLIPNLLFSKAIGITVGVLARKIGGDAWTAMVIGFLAGTVLMLIMTYLNTKFPDKTIIQYSEEIVGKVVSKFISAW